MYKLIIRGQDPIFIDDAKGKVLFDKWTQTDKMVGKIVINGFGFFGTDIKSIQRIEKTEAELAPKQMTQLENDYSVFRKKMLGLEIDERANIMRIPNMVWQAHSKDPMPQEIKEEIKQRQFLYFEQNPNCIYCNPKVYKDLMPKFRFSRGIDGLSPIQNSLPAVMMRLIENIIHTDLVEAGK